jgi:hypothetical protein
MLSTVSDFIDHPVQIRLEESMIEWRHCFEARVPLEQIKGSSEPTLPHCLVADEGAQQRESDGRISDL